MMRVHVTGDAYVSADHGEGWCRPVQEAMLMGKPVVGTARGCIHEHLLPELYFPVPSTYVPVVQQPFIPWYTSEQNWAQIDKESLKKAMLTVFENRHVAHARGLAAKEFVKEKFSYQRVGRLMELRLEKIVKAL